MKIAVILGEMEFGPVIGYNIYGVATIDKEYVSCYDVRQAAIDLAKKLDFEVINTSTESDGILTNNFIKVLVCDKVIKLMYKTTSVELEISDHEENI